MRNIFLIGALFFAIQANGQTSLGFVFESRLKNVSPEEGVDGYINLGLSVKKNLTTDLNLVSGLSFRYFDADVRTISENTDLVTYHRDVYENDLFYIVKGEYFRFSYATLPIGVEFKVTTFLRLQYNLENNFLLGANDPADEYLQYGKKSLARHMFSHSAFVSFHQNAVGIGFGVILNPAIIRSDVKYTYQFMQDFQTTFKESYFFSFRLWADFQFRKRKKVL